MKTFTYNKNKPIEIGDIPIDTQRLELGSKFNQPIENIPLSVYSLRLTEGFNKYLDIPSNIKRLTFFAKNYLFSIDNLPDTIEYLQLTGCKINILPNKLKFLSIDNYDSKTVLPDTIEDLELSQCFNKPISKFPLNLTRLTFGIYYNQPLENLSNGLLYLTLGYDFNQCIDNLPDSIIKLELESCCFNKTINKYPKNLEYLSVLNDISKSFSLLPESTKTIKTTNANNVNNLPDTVEKLIIGDGFFQIVDANTVNFNVNLKIIKMMSFDKRELIKMKIPFGCEIVNYNDKTI
jgi:hypothetical protein